MRKFWSTPSSWPMDPIGYVFLARAMDELGRARYGRDWTGKEYSVEMPRALPEKFSNLLNEGLQIYDFLRKHRPDIELASLGRVGNDIRKVTLTPEQWALALSTQRKIAKKVLPTAQRGADIRTEVVRRCEAGALVSYHRPTRGGDLAPIPRSWWNTETNHNRFVMCQINPRDPYGIAAAGDAFAWIFVTRDSLDRCLALLPHHQTLETQIHLSPYLRLMLAVVKSMNISTENQPKKAAVIARLSETWNGKEPLSNKLLESMATLVREPESQLGRAQKIIGKK